MLLELKSGEIVAAGWDIPRGRAKRLMARGEAVRVEEIIAVQAARLHFHGDAEPLVVEAGASIRLGDNPRQDEAGKLLLSAKLDGKPVFVVRGGVAEREKFSVPCPDGEILV